jgi:hypothetical protein
MGFPIGGMSGSSASSNFSGVSFGGIPIQFGTSISSMTAIGGGGGGGGDQDNYGNFGLEQTTTPGRKLMKGKRRLGGA